eukprot:scaffold74934_cov69-Cyclotella_meneghiniana.AAC.2
MSKDTSEREGRHCFCCGCVMYFSTPFLIVCITMSQPPWTPTAKLNDCSAGVLLVVSRLASYNALMSPWRNLLSRCEMSFRVVTLSGSGFGASGEEFVKGFKYVVLCGEGEAVVADE